MIFSARIPKGEKLASEEISLRQRDLPALLRRGDLGLLVILVTIIASDVQGMQFAEYAAFFYWILALLTFQLPSLFVFCWLARQAPRHVRLYEWIMRLAPTSLRSILLFLIWWPGVLIALATFGMSATLLLAFFPTWLHTFPYQCLAFILLLAGGTWLISLPLKVFRWLLWVGGILYVGTFLIIAITSAVVLTQEHSRIHIFVQPFTIGLPTHFSWALFGLALLCLFGLNGPLLMDGEMYGRQRFMRGSTSMFWWGGLCSFGILLIMTGAWMVLNPTLRIMETPLLLLSGSVLGDGVGFVGRVSLFVGTFGCALAYVFLFARAFLLAARMDYLPRSFARLGRWDTPTRVLLLQFALILGTAAIIFVLIPLLLRGVLAPDVVRELGTGDQLSLFTSVACSLWGGLNVLMFVFALWLCWKKRRRTQETWKKRVALSVCCIVGSVSSLVCGFAPLLPDWPALFFSRTRWYPLVLLGVLCSLVLAWTIGELPRRSALVRAKAKSLAREKTLREELQQAYVREQTLHQQLQASYDEVNRLYREQERMAMTDVVTGLFNRRAFLLCLERIIARCQDEESTFLLFFVDLDHFKSINDTWSHLAGDVVLQEAAQRLRQAILPGDIAGRYGGEEFGLIMPGATLAQAEEEGERLCRIMRASPCLWQDSQGEIVRIELTASIGIAEYGVHGTNSKDLLSAADQAMYEAKLAGRNCARVAGSTRVSR